MKKSVSYLYTTSRSQTRETVFFKNKDHRSKVTDIARRQGGKIITKSKTVLIYQLPPKKE